MLVLADEQIGLVRRARRGISVTEEALALDVIEAIGPGGEFLTSEHTLSHFRDELWFPSLMDRQGYDGWRDGGATTMGQRARQKVERILDTHQRDPLSEATLARLARIRDGTA